MKKENQNQPVQDNSTEINNPSDRDFQRPGTDTDDGAINEAGSRNAEDDDAEDIDDMDADLTEEDLDENELDPEDTGAAAPGDEENRG